MATKPKKKARYDLKAADRKRNLLVQIGLTAVVVVFAVGLVLYIVMSSDKPVAGEAKPVRVASADLITKEGTAEPKAVLALYEDFLCPHCADFEQQFGPTISRLIERGAVQADYYMVSILNTAQNDNYPSRAAAAAYCVADESTEAFQRFHSALFVMQPREMGAQYPTNAQLIETARQAGAGGDVAECINSGRYIEMVDELAGTTGINSTPSVRINGEDYRFSTPDALVTKIKEIVGDLPGLEAAAPARPAPSPTAP